MRPPVLLVAVASAAIACADPPPLGLSATPISVGYDRSAIVDIAAVDPDHDGDLDLLVATADDFRHMTYEADRQAWVEATGAGLSGIPPVQAMHPEGDDYILVREAGLSRLVYSGIGSWAEEPGPVPAAAPEPILEVAVDLDGDGRMDTARLDGRRLLVSWRTPEGDLLDVSRRVGADGLLLPTTGTRLIAGDLDGDGHVDLLAAGGRLFALFNNGGTL